MLDRYLNGTPTFYKWDKFWVGALPALLVPFVGLVLVFLVTWLNARVSQHENFTPHMFLVSMQSSLAFMRISTLCCMLNGGVFYFFMRKDYNNASRGVIVVTMLYVLAISIKEIL
ncbi:MAG TPA: hypothetical protein VK174_06475 [Chitinophagales bacterium]|nr:hypothetical protein [Chitinophagales bacterium]HLP50906.1 hypothetical protein [Chitinophagales bacterium]